MSELCEMVSFLSAYVRINTAHPHPAYDQALTFLAEQAAQAELPYQLIALGNGNQAFVATVQGADASLPALALTHHMDVVPVTDEAAWAFPPFAGAVAEGSVHGRGTQDMKGVAAVHFQVLRMLAARGLAPRRTVHLIAVPDEERGGFGGTQLLLQTPAFAALGIGYVLDEGLASGKPAGVLVKVTERKPLQVMLEARGAAAHGSHLLADNPIHGLVMACAALAAGQRERRSCCTELQDRGTILSANLTSLQAGQAATYNAVPASATAVVDMRLPQAMPVREALAYLDTVVAAVDGVSYRVLAHVDDYALADQQQTHLFAAVAQACEAQGLAAIPYHAEEASDLRYYWQRGVVGLGISPFTCQQALHATNESLPVVQLERGYQLLAAVVEKVCF